MDEIVGRILDGQDQIKTDIAEIKSDLKYHIKRTDLLDSALDKHKKDAQTRDEALQAELKPVKRHVALIEASLKILGLVALLVGLGSGLVNILKFFH